MFKKSVDITLKEYLWGGEKIEKNSRHVNRGAKPGFIEVTEYFKAF